MDNDKIVNKQTNVLIIAAGIVEIIRLNDRVFNMDHTWTHRQAVEV